MTDPVRTALEKAACEMCICEGAAWIRALDPASKGAADLVAQARREAPGMVLVPREPTPAMIEAGGYALQEHAAMTMDAARIAWDAMVKAGSKP